MSTEINERDATDFTRLHVCGSGDNNDDECRRRSIITTALFTTAMLAPKSLKHHTKHAEHRIKICKSIEMKRHEIRKSNNKRPIYCFRQMNSIFTHESNVNVILVRSRAHLMSATNSKRNTMPIGLLINFANELLSS